MSGDGERASRPTSLLLEAVPPEREPLRFDVQLVGAPPEVEQLVNNIKQVAEDFLYHWKTFPIVLPPSKFTGPGNRLSDIILPPPCDEIDAVLLDAGSEPLPLSPKQLHDIREKGLHQERVYKPKKLSAKQLESVREWGEFEVPSRHFPGQTHVWRVAGWLQRGRARAREDLYCHVARAVALVVVGARNRLLKDEPVSVISGAKAFARETNRLLDLLIGMPSLEARDLEKKIREERSRYLVAELICKPEHSEDIAGLAAWVSRALRRAATEKSEAPRHPPPVPCLYTTPQRTQVDLRLYRRETMRRASATLQALLEREARGWFLHFRERTAAHLATQKMPPHDIEEEVREAAMLEYVTRVRGAVLASEPLRALGGAVPKLLAHQLLAYHITSRAEEGVCKKVSAGVATAEARLRAAHPVLSRAAAWRAERGRAAHERLADALRWAAREDAAAAMRHHQLHQHAYFMLRDLTFLRDREPLLVKELQAAKTPTRVFEWSCRTWSPARWKVTRHFRGRAERIPTVLSARATSIVTPRSDPSQPVFLVDRDVTTTTTTRWPGWRLLNYAHRTWCWSWNMMFLLGVVVPWCSPFSVRSLVCIKPFVPDYELSQVNGTLFPKRSSETQTMWSRLLMLWRLISKERTRFEAQPDSGLLGKGVTRHMHRVWYYGVVGFLGSVGVLVVFPVVAVAGCVLSVAAAASVPLWTPAATALVHAANLLFYDYDTPDRSTNQYFPVVEVLIRLCVQGVLQPLVALALGLLVCPACSLVLFVGGVWWWVVRRAWEAGVWRAVLARGARAPLHDSAFCRRVRGPGLNDTTYYQITAGQALAGLRARAEAEALGARAAQLEAAVDRPLRDYEHFVHACFGPFAVHISKTGAYKQLEKECSELKASLREKVSARLAELELALGPAVRARVRLPSHHLGRVVQAGAAELADVWGAAGAGGAGGDEWWLARGLDPGDWRALAANTLAEAFDPEILVGLEAHEARLQLEGGEECERWEARCGHAPPDVVGAEWAEWGGGAARRVRAPVLDVLAFSPRARPHLLPPVPHPAIVAVVLHNRESDNPVPLDSELCAEILRTLEDAPDSDDRRDGVERYRGGGSDGSSLGSDYSGEEGGDGGDETPSPPDEQRHPPLERCRASSAGESRALCRWTLTGRGVRLRADLASPEDVSLDADRAHGTSV